MSLDAGKGPVIGMELWNYLGIEPVAALAVVVSSVVLYLAFIVLTRFLGQRVLMSLSGFDLVVVIVLGAVLGRSTLGYTPTLAGGLIAVVTLFAFERALGRLTARPGWERLVNNRAVVLMAGADPLDDELKRAHITKAELRSRLRQAGIRSDEEVAAVVLEPNGTISVLRRGTLVDPQMLADARGSERMPADLLNS